ncbi:hypothetical protein DE146DRAFT_136329 [Phaeosphaeria sp. MPI-PUGE-AT-0046c]|nr:hypothetical protein DE146DRAFT_136329 [Phaeosphaeria sp. MPI-PUGE-AT-0046c]
MDRIDASLEVINLICTTLNFIQEVIKGSQSSISTSTHLSRLHGFLDAFSDLCFSDVTGLLRDARVAESLILDVQKSLFALNKALAAHREAWRYVSVTSEAKRQQDGRHRSSTITSGLDGQKEMWRKEMKYRSQLWRERASAGVQSALFDSEEMDALLSVCDIWTDRLQHTLSIVLLIAGERSPHFPSHAHCLQLGIGNVLERQRRLGLKPSENYRPLTGQLRKSVSSTQPNKSLMKTVYNDGGEEVDVMVEIRPYSETPAGSIKQLAWYLSASSPPPAPFRQYDRRPAYRMLTLSCVGYMDDPTNARSLILYRSPRSHPWASDPSSLHDAVAKGWSSKMSLSQRFDLARTLAASVLDIHTSGSLHKNITSREIAVLPRNLNDTEPSPYLLGWGVDTPPRDTVAILEPNLYRHQTQFGLNPHPSTTDQDVYSLGVVLLEIGLWTTMSTVFTKLLETSPRFGVREERALFKKVNRVILDLAYSPDLRKEMGMRYAKVVQLCLEWNYKDTIESLLKFRTQVVDVLEMGCRL